MKLDRKQVTPIYVYFCTGSNFEEFDFYPAALGMGLSLESATIKACSVTHHVAEQREQKTFTGA